jgi:VanZ family protein
MAAIFVVSAQPTHTIPVLGVWNTLLKKLGHFVAYAVLAALSLRVTDELRRPHFWAFMITAVYAVSDEWHQTFVPTRNGTPVDVLIDCAGGLTALVMLRHLQRRSSRQSP